MPILGVTGVEIAPALHLHFVAESFLGCCCCGGEDPKKHEPGTQYYIDRKLKAQRWQDKRGHDGMAATHARLKLVVVQRFQKISKHPFADAEQAFTYANLDWLDPFPLYRDDLDRLDEAVQRVKHEIFDEPMSDI